MFVKLIRVHTTPERRAGFLARQRQWNAALGRCPGFVDAVVGSSTEDPGVIFVITTWEDRVALDRFMAGRHDAVEAETDMRSWYDRIEVHHLEVAPDLERRPRE